MDVLHREPTAKESWPASVCVVPVEKDAFTVVDLDVVSYLFGGPGIEKGCDLDKDSLRGWQMIAGSRRRERIGCNPLPWGDPVAREEVADVLGDSGALEIED